MKTPALLSAATLVLAAPVLAQFQSVRLHPDNAMPAYPPAMHISGITRGYAVVATSIDTEGKVQDALVLAHTHERFADAALVALRGWRFIPARLDGQPVPVQTELRIDFSLEGAVVTSNIVNHFFFDSFDSLGDMAASRQLCPPSRLDRQPARVAGEAPGYARQAARDGVAGRVRVHFYIDERGDVRLAGAEPDPGLHPYLLEQAVHAVRRWKFEPPTSGGRPVMVAAVQNFEFGATP